MLFGCTPFKGSNRHATFSNVLRNEVAFPDHPATTTLCKSMIKKLLCKDEHRRLGSQSGASEVKQHKWFASISWGLLRHQKPPIVPQVTYVCDQLHHSRGLRLTLVRFPACSNAENANFRSMRESKSLDLEGQAVWLPWPEAEDGFAHTPSASPLPTPSITPAGTPGVGTPKASGGSSGGEGASSKGVMRHKRQRAQTHEREETGADGSAQETPVPSTAAFAT